MFLKLTSLLAFTLIALSESVQGTPRPRAAATLQAGMESTGRLFWGSAADQNTLRIPQNEALLVSEFGAVTPENSMKWDATEPTQGQFTFGGADFLVDWAVKNGKQIRGHTLVWHAQLPSWVSAINDPNTLTEVIQSHISNVAGRYAGKLYAWDVCNEILNDDGTLRSSVFSRVLGQSFVKIAFDAARAADPKAKLYINDFNLDSNNAKVQGMVKLVNEVNKAGKVIDGIGTQTHLSAGGAGGVAAAITALASTGAEVAVTELDIAGASANDYTAVLRACLNEPRCVSITTWGVSDANSWRAGESPLLYDANFQPKAALGALLNTF